MVENNKKMNNEVLIVYRFADFSITRNVFPLQFWFNIKGKSQAIMYISI